jgi:uncharacterized protein (DUF2461 family)
MKNYLRDRFYLRGRTPLGMINTVLAAIFNRVVVKYIDDTGKIVRISIKRGTDFPKEKSDE